MLSSRLLFLLSVTHQTPIVKLFDRWVCRLGFNKAPLTLNFAKFKVPVRRSSWLSTRSFRTLSRKAQFERSSTHLNILLSKTRSFHFTRRLGYQSIYGTNLQRFRYWRTPKYEGLFLYYDYEDYIEQALLRFRCKRTKDPNAHLSNDDIDCSNQVRFSNPLVQHPQQYPVEQNLVLPVDPLESITFKMLNRRTPRFMQSD